MNGQKSRVEFLREEGAFSKKLDETAPLIYSPAEAQLLVTGQLEARPLWGGWLESLNQSPVATLDCMHMLDLHLLETQEQYSR